MPVADVKNLEGKKVGTIDLADDVFGVKVNAHLLHEAVRHHLASKHAGTHKTKDKSEVSGSGRKLWKQKGTGRARVGSIRSPLWRHGGTVHGPTPRSYSYALPKKMIIGALRSALSSKLAEQKMTIVDAWELETHKTKAFRQALTKLDKETPSILLVDNSSNVNLERASRNIDGLTLVPTNGLEAYDLLRHDHLMMSREAAVKLSRALSPNPQEQEQPIQIQPAPGASSKQTVAEKTVHTKPVAKTHSKTEAAPKAAKKHAAGTKEKPKAKSKPKAKKE
jgi:large subunit ribosomal protein L4